MDDLDEQQQQEQQQDDQQQAADETSEAEQQADRQGQGADDEDGEVVITIGDEAPPAANDDEIEGKPAPAWVKELRKENRELKKRQRELEQAEAARQVAAAPKVEEVGPEPDLSDEDVEFDPDKFKAKWKAWNEAKAKADAKADAERKAVEAQQAEWTKTVSAYRAAGAALKVGNFEDAEAVVVAALDPVQQKIMVHGPDNAQDAARLVAALSRNPAELKKLADIKDMVKYTVALTKLLGKLKDVPVKQPPPAERQVRSSAGGATAVDSTEARLEAEADRTGNRTALIAYRKQKVAKAAA